jgi:hypothetical protein
VNLDVLQVPAIGRGEARRPFIVEGMDEGDFIDMDTDMRAWPRGAGYPGAGTRPAAVQGRV